MTAYYETFKRTDKSDDYVYRAIRYNVFKHRAINRLTYGWIDYVGLSIIDLIFIWIKGYYIVEMPDKRMKCARVAVDFLTLDSMVKNFTPFDPGPYVLSGGVPCGRKEVGND